MTTAAALFLVLAFLALFTLLGVPRRAQAALSRTREAFAVLRDRQLDDIDKERAMQAHSKALFVAFVVITALCAAALVVPAGIVWLLAQAELVDFDAAVAATLSWPILIGTTVAAFVLLRLRRTP